MNSQSQPELPGYFWDPEKRRYFKVEKNHHAAPGASWSSDNVKKRKRDAAVAAERTRYEAQSISRITRSRVLNEPLMGGFLAREYGDNVRDLNSAAFARGLVYKGKVPVGLRTNNNVRNMFVTNKKDKNGVYPVFTHDGSSRFIFKSSMGRDNKTERINEPWVSPNTTKRIFIRPSGQHQRVSDIKCDVTGTHVIFSLPTIPHRSLTPIFIMDLHNPSNDYRPVEDTQRYCCVPNTICVSPLGNSTLCLAGTNLGLATVDNEIKLNLSIPTGWESQRDHRAALFRDIFGVDYHITNPNVVFFGGRPGGMFIGDFRQDVYKWSNIQLPTSIAHIKAVNDNQVLVAGLENMMSVYDVRFCDSVRVRKYRHTRKVPNRKLDGNPIVRMPEYKNQARFGLGFDLDRDSGVVAAAHEDGKVALYSVRSGRRLPSRDIDGIHSPAEPVHCLQFQTLEGDHTPTLFAGLTSEIHAFSFGVDDVDDEC